MLYPSVFNSAAAGADSKIYVFALDRNQWVGIEGAPHTTIFSGELSLPMIGQEDAISMTFMQDEIGYYKDITFEFGYTYRRDFNRGKLSAGVNVGLFSKNLTPGWSLDGVDPDPSIPTEEISGSSLDLDFGLYYFNDRSRLGISASHINSPKFEYNDGKNIEVDTHIYLFGSHKIPIEGSDISLTPSFLIKSDFSSTIVDLSVVGNYNKFTGGVGYRSNTISLLAGTPIINKLYLNYSYDISLSSIGQYSNGSHEFSVSYKAKFIKKSVKINKSIRFL